MKVELVKYDAARYALQQAVSVDEVKDIRDKAMAMEAYAKQAKDTELIAWANEIKIRAERKTGELLKEMPKAKGTKNQLIGRGVIGGNTVVPPIDEEKTLEELGITKRQSAQWQKVADIPENKFEELMQLLPMTTATVIKNVHVSNNSGENEWYTPSKYIESARLTMVSIDLDPASSELANKTVKAQKFYSSVDNGLNYDWFGNVWLNPPYAQPLINQFSEKLIEEYDKNIKQAIVLVNNATETNWFQNMAQHASAICFPATRIKFIDLDGKPSGSPLQGQCFLYFGDNAEAFKENFHQYGLVFIHG